MSKGIAAMGFLDKTTLALSLADGDRSVEAIKALVNELAKLQANDQGALSAVQTVCNGKTPWQNSDWTITSKVGASGTVTAATAIAGNTVTVNGLLYTAVAGVKANNTEFSIDTGNNETATDLADSISNDTRTGTLNVSLSAVAVSAVVTITAGKVEGSTYLEGNDITLVSSGGTLAVSGAVFTGGVDYQAAFVSEVSNLSDDAKGRLALSTRRLIDIEMDITTDASFQYSFRSFLAAIKFIESLEDKVAETGVGSTGDATYTAAVLNGATPYESFTWTITKLGNDYSLVPTATS